MVRIFPKVSADEHLYALRSLARQRGRRGLWRPFLAGKMEHIFRWQFVPTTGKLDKASVAT